MDEELKVSVKTEEFVRKLTEVQKAIQETKKEMEDLYRTGAKGFSDIDKAKDYDVQMGKLRDKLKDVTKEEEKLVDATKQVDNANKEATKSADKLGDAVLSGAKKWTAIGAAIGLVTKFVDEVIKAFKDTVLGLNAITIAGEVWKQMAYNVATLNVNILDYSKSLVTAIGVGKLMNQERKNDREDLIKTSQLREDYNKLYFESADRTKSLTYQLQKLTEAEEVHNKMIDMEIENAQRQLLIIELRYQGRRKSNKVLDEEAQILAKINTIEGQRYSETKRVEQRRSSLENEIHQKSLKAWYDEIDAMVKQRDEFQKMSLKLLDDYEKAQIDFLEGNDRVRAQRDYGLKQLEEFRKQMEKLGKLSKGQEKQFAILGAAIWTAYYEGLSEAAQKKLPQKDIDAISKALKPQLEGLRDFGGTLARKGGVPMTSIWQLFGIDPETEEGAKMIDTLTDAKDRTIEVIDEIYQARVTDTQRQRELLDTQIAETQRALELETELYKSGYASNVAAKQAELAELEKQRAAALRKEEEAIKRQKQLDTITQVSSLITASAQTFKAFPGPLLPVAIAVIAAMFAAFAASKIKANETTKLAEGGSGTVRGKRHSQGGERFLDHVEIEQGEHWGVLSRRAASKYGDVFHDMVSSFNKDQMPEFITPAFSNNIRVDNNGPNKRLDKIYSELEKQNKGREEVMLMGDQYIIRKGNNVRIIKR